MTFSRYLAAFVLFGAANAFAAQADDSAEAAQAAPAETQTANGEAAAAETPAAPLPPRASNPMVQAAADYAHFRGDLAAIGQTELVSGEIMDSVMDRLASHEPERLSRAWLAYSAMIATQHAPFVDQVKTVADFYGRENVIKGLLNEPEWAITFKNSSGAADAVAESAMQESGDLYTLGQRFKQQSYDLQHFSWANVVTDRGGRLDLIELPERHGDAPESLVVALSDAAPVSSADTDIESQTKREALWEIFDPLHASITAEEEAATDATVLGSEGQDEAAGLTTPLEAISPATAEAFSQPVQTVGAEEETLGRILALAALDVLDAGGDRPEAMMTMMTSQPTESCLAWAHSQLKVCVAAGHFKYEDAFCISEHQLTDTAQCFGALVGN